MKRILLACIVLVVSLLVAWSMRANAFEPPPAQAADPARTHLTEKPTDLDRKVLKQIQETKVSFDFNDRPLVEVVDFVMTLCTTNIVPERTKFVDPETKITFKMTNASLETVFDRLLEQEGFAWLIRDGVVVISDEAGIKEAAAAAARSHLTEKPTDADGKVLRRLQETIVSFEFNEQPVMEALVFLENQGSVNILLDRNKLEDPAPVVTLKLRNVSLDTALKLVTEQLGLTFIIRDGLVFISDEKGVQEVPVAVIDAQGETIVKALGEKKVSFNLEDQTLEEAVAFLGTLASANIAVDPRAKLGEQPAREATVTLKLKDVSVWQAVRELSAAAGLHVIVSEQLVLLTDLKELKPLGDPGVPQEMAKTMDGTVVSFAFHDTPLRQVMEFLRKLGDIQVEEVTVDEDVGKRPVTLKVKNMKLRYAFNWSARFTGTTWSIGDERLVIRDEQEAK
jgi:hypothetical protein